MNKVYLVETDNGESYEDYHTSIVGAFATYRKASQLLINRGYEPFANRWQGEWTLSFYWEESDEYMADCSTGRVFEMNIEE